MIPGSLDELRTARMRLVRLTPVDGADLLNMHNNPHVSPTLGGPATEDDGRLRLARTSNIGSATVGLLDCPRPLDDAFLGRGGLRHQSIDGRDEVELGYGFAPEAWGKGLATELARESVRVAFDVLKLPDLICSHCRRIAHRSA